jgi:hypothetical protein
MTKAAAVMAFGGAAGRKEGSSLLLLQEWKVSDGRDEEE